MGNRLLRVMGGLFVLWLALVMGALVLGTTRSATPVSFVLARPQAPLLTFDPGTAITYTLFSPNVGELLVNYAWSPNGKRLAVTQLRDNQTVINVREPDGHWWSFESPQPFRGNWVHWSADSTHLVILHGQTYTLVDMGTRTRNTLSLEANLFAEVDFFVSLTPTTALVRGQMALDEPLQYYMLDLPTGDLSVPPTLPCEASPDSYDGWARPGGGLRGVYICVPDGIFLADGNTTPRKLLGDTIFDDLRYFRKGVWLSPDGNRVLFQRDSNNAHSAGRGGIYVLDVATRDAWRVLDWQGVTHVRWGPPATSGSSR